MRSYCKEPPKNEIHFLNKAPESTPMKQNMEVNECKMKYRVLRDTLCNLIPASRTRGIFKETLFNHIPFVSFVHRCFQNIYIMMKCRKQYKNRHI